jgi:hypothetical protein
VPAPAVPPGRGRRFVVGMVSATVVVVVIAVVVGLALFRVLTRDSPRETTDKFLSAMKAKNFTSAQAALCADGRRRESTDALRDAFELKDHTIASYTIDSERKTTGPDNGKRTAVAATLTYENGTKLNVEIDVVNQSGGKVCGFKVPA